MCLHGEIIGAEKRIEVSAARADMQTKSTEHVYPRGNEFLLSYKLVQRRHQCLITRR